MIYLLISGGSLVLIGVIVGAVLMRYGIGLGNQLTLSSKDGIPINEEVISTSQDMTE